MCHNKLVGLAGVNYGILSIEQMNYCTFCAGNIACKYCIYKIQHQFVAQYFRFVFS